MDRVPLDRVKSVLPVIASKRVNELVIDYSRGKGALRYVHGLEESPLVFLDIINLARIEEHILDAIIPAHHIDIVITNDSCVFLPHL